LPQKRRRTHKVKTGADRPLTLYRRIVHDQIKQLASWTRQLRKTARFFVTFLVYRWRFSTMFIAKLFLNSN